MRRIVATIVSFLAACVAAGILFFVIRNADSPDPVSSTGETAELQEDLERTEADRAQLQEELSAAQERIQQLEEAAVETDSLVEELNRTAAKSGEPAEEAAEEHDEEEDELTLDDVRARIRDNAQATAQIQALTGLVFADFLNAVELDADVKAEVRKLLGESYLEVSAFSGYAMRKGNLTWREVAEVRLEERAFLSDALEEVLPDDAFQTWSDFAQNIDAHVLYGTLRNQIRALAGGLTEENFEVVMDVAVEEFLAEQAALERTDELFTQSENIYYQFRAMETMGDRLQEILPEDQYAEVENFFAFAENALNAQLPKEEQE